jgi:hypothetical protein
MVEVSHGDRTMDWQERLWGWLQRAGPWPDKVLEILCMLTALAFLLGALAYGYFPFFVIGGLFMVGAWLAEEKRLSGQASLASCSWALLGRFVRRPLRTIAALALVVAGLWQEAVWLAIVGLVVLRWAGRGAPSAREGD